MRGGLFGNLDDCDSSHLNNCKSESECKGAGGVWKNGTCVSNEKITTTSKNAYPSEPLNAIKYVKGEKVKNPADYIVKVPASENVYIQPSLK